METMLLNAGFTNVNKSAHSMSTISDINHFDDIADRSSYSLYVECMKEE